MAICENFVYDENQKVNDVCTHKKSAKRNNKTIFLKKILLKKIKKIFYKFFII